MQEHGGDQLILHLARTSAESEISLCFQDPCPPRCHLNWLRAKCLGSWTGISCGVQAANIPAIAGQWLLSPPKHDPFTAARLCAKRTLVKPDPNEAEVTGMFQDEWSTPRRCGPTGSRTNHSFHRIPLCQATQPIQNKMKQKNPSTQQSGCWLPSLPFPFSLPV